jgi:hypothetical protein
MSSAHPVYLLDITTGLTRKLIEYLEKLAFVLGRPPERKSIFPQDYPVDFPRIRVSVQLSEERLRYDEARLREMERAAGHRSPEMEARIYARRSAEEYEAQARRKVVHDWEKVRGDIYKPHHKRAVILGDPGFGKSWLLRFEGRQLALAEIGRLKKSAIGTTGVLIPVFARLAKLAEHTGSLLERLEPVLKEDARINEIPHVGDLWPLIAKKIERGQALLLLDGWDEVRQNKEFLKQAVQAFAEQSMERRIYLTSRIAGYEAISLDSGKTTECELVSFTPAQVKSFVQSYFHEDGRNENGAALLHALEHNVQLMGLGRIPLMLALLCRISWEKRADEKLPTRRVEIYKDCLWGLVYKWKYGTSESVVDVDSANTTIDLLAEISLSLFLASPHVDAWSLPELKARVGSLSGSSLSQAECVALIDQLIKDGVLVREGEDERSPLRFIHRTFREYLAATAVAGRVNANDGRVWEFPCIEVENKHGEQKKVNTKDFIDAKSWDPNWQEVICLLAGQLKDATPLLKLLQEPKTDDRLRHRICVSVLCLGELRKDRSPAVSNLTDRIAWDIFHLWRSGECLHDIGRHLTAAAADNLKIIDAVLALLKHPDWHVRDIAADALGRMGESAAKHPSAIDALLALLEDSCSDVYYPALHAFMWIGESAAKHPGTIDALLTLLKHPDRNVRPGAFHALGRMGESAAKHPGTIDALLALLEDPDSDMRRSAAAALQHMGESAAKHPGTIDAVLALLDDKDSKVRSRAGDVLEQMGVRVFEKGSAHYPWKTVAELSKL